MKHLLDVSPIGLHVLLHQFHKHGIHFALQGAAGADFLTIALIYLRRGTSIKSLREGFKKKQ